MDRINPAKGSNGNAILGFTSFNEEATNGSTVQKSVVVPNVLGGHEPSDAASGPVSTAPIKRGLTTPNYENSKGGRNVNKAKEKAREPEAKAHSDNMDPSGLYAMPDMSAKTSRKSKALDHPSANDSAAYASPVEMGDLEGEEDFSALYATSTKHRPDPVGGNTGQTGDLYAVPAKNRKGESNVEGRNEATYAAPDEDVAALYAMPDKRGTVDQDETEMHDNELYASM